MYRQVPMMGLSCVLKRRFDDPIALPNGRKLVTLQDAGDYIIKLPKAEHEAREWAIEMLLKAAERSEGWLWFARISFRHPVKSRFPMASYSTS
jgi:hypothetical protein